MVEVEHVHQIADSWRVGQHVRSLASCCGFGSLSLQRSEIVGSCQLASMVYGAMTS
jgi:hypothetical protein